MRSVSKEIVDVEELLGVDVGVGLASGRGSMIARYWTARATVEGARAYVEVFQRTLVPRLAQLDGHRGALVFDRPLDDGVEITVLTLWESMEAIARFAGSTPERAMVEPEADAVLRDYDHRVRHLTLRLDTATSRR